MSSQCPNGEDEGVDLCYDEYLKKGLVTKYATYNCHSIMYPDMEIVATACNYEVECHDLSDESRCTDEVSQNILIITTVAVATIYLLMKYVRKIYHVFIGKQKRNNSKVIKENPMKLLNMLEQSYEDSNVLMKVNTYLFCVIFTETKKRRIEICSSFYDKMAKIHNNDKSYIYLNMKKKLDPLVVHNIIDCKFPGIRQKTIILIERIFGEFISKTEDKITQIGWLGSIFFTLKRILSIEFKYIDLFKDIFLTVYIMILSGGPLAVMTYSTNFTSVVVMLMVTSIILPAILSSLHLLINSPHIIYSIFGINMKKISPCNRIGVSSLVVLLSIMNPILLRDGVFLT